MLFYVKIKLKMDRLPEMLQRSAKGEIPSVVKYSTIYCSDTEPGLGYSIFDVENKDQLDEILDKLTPYSEVYEVASVITLKEFQVKLTT